MSVTNQLITASTGLLPMLSQSLRRPGLQTPANRERAGEEPMREIIKLGRDVLRRKQCVELALDLVGIDGVSLPIAPTPWTHQEH